MTKPSLRGPNSVLSDFMRNIEDNVHLISVKERLADGRYVTVYLETLPLKRFIYWVNRWHSLNQVPYKVIPK